MTEEEIKHEETLAKIKSRSEAFNRSPIIFTLWDWVTTLMHVTFWIGFWFLIAQCSCEGCITK